MSGLSIQTRFILPVSLFVIVIVLGGSLVFSAIENQRIRSGIDVEAAQISEHVLKTLGVIDTLVMEQTRGAMRLLIERGSALGAPGLGEQVTVRGRQVPDLVLGSSPQANNFELVDGVVRVAGGTATLFVTSGDEFVRVSTNVMRDGERAIGTILDPQGRAIAAIRDGRGFYGLVDILGNPFLTGYEPIRDAASRIVGIWYVGYQIDMDALRQTVDAARLLDGGFMAVFDQTGQLRFRSGHVTDEAVMAVTAGASGWVVGANDFDAWGFRVVTAYPEAEVARISRGRMLSIVLTGAVGCMFLISLLVWLLRKLVLGPLGGEPAVATAVANRIAAGDLTSNVTLHAGDDQSMLAAMARMQHRLREIVRDINDSANALGEAAVTLVEESGSVSDGVARQNEATSSIASTVEQITTSIAQVSDNAGVAREVANDASVLSEEGRSVVGTVVAEMQATAESVNASAGLIRDLGEASDQISKVVNVIREVAEQTNLLALNAAIEAARAGESGRGFAVVADEVRKLAERTSTSTHQIAEVIERIQTGVRRAVTGIDAGVLRVGTSVDKAEHAGESMTRIYDGSTRVVEVVNDISDALREQATASEAIARNVQQIAQMNEESTVAVRSVLRDAENLRELATRLKDSVRSFRLGNDF